MTFTRINNALFIFYFKSYPMFIIDFSGLLSLKIMFENLWLTNSINWLFINFINYFLKSFSVLNSLFGIMLKSCFFKLNILHNFFNYLFKNPSNSLIEKLTTFLFSNSKASCSKFFPIESLDNKKSSSSTTSNQSLLCFFSNIDLIDFTKFLSNCVAEWFCYTLFIRKVYNHKFSNNYLYI